MHSEFDRKAEGSKVALHLADVMRVGAPAALGLLMSACGEPMPTDAEMIETLQSDRAGFDEAIQVACETPALTSIRIAEDKPPETKPVNLPPARIQALRTFMTKHSVSVAYFQCEPPTFASFTLASSGLSTAGQMKELMFSPSGISNDQGGVLVPDTDSAVAAEKEKWIQVHRDIGDGWFIRNSEG